MEELDVEEWRGPGRCELDGELFVHPGGLSRHESPTARRGRIINNGSVSAHAPRPNSAPYTATKHAITGLTRSTSLDGRNHGIACGQIDIGNALTDMTARMAGGVMQAHGGTAVEPTMNVDDIGRAIIYMAGLPLAANVLFMTVMANSMPFVGRG
ncbi:MAG: hypothetical protein Ct9H300mP16_11900 [Pseudomonadota bacterium]|nr:MAG: hypothetical protein Ct9H300mP16_11900 [Pseudomonadota bacterium]